MKSHKTIQAKGAYLTWSGVRVVKCDAVCRAHFFGSLSLCSITICYGIKNQIHCIFLVDVFHFVVYPVSMKFCPVL